MNKESITKSLKGLKRTVGKHSPEILTGVGIAGMISTTVLAVKATPKAMVLIEERNKLELEEDEDFYKLGVVETVKVAWKPYIPAVLLGVASTACLISANTVSAKRTAALATAYKLSEAALTEYKEKVVETIGEKKAKTIKENIVKGKIEKDPVSNKEVIITGSGETLCYDVMSGRYFKSDIDKLRKAENIINRTITYDMYASLNEFYCEVGLKPTKQGDDLGWNMDDGLLELDFGSALADDGTPCVVIDYSIAPRYNYSKLQ